MKFIRSICFIYIALEQLYWEGFRSLYECFSTSRLNFKKMVVEDKRRYTDFPENSENRDYRFTKHLIFS